jgi:hypothetical protein
MTPNKKEISMKSRVFLDRVFKFSIRGRSNMPINPAGLRSSVPVLMLAAAAAVLVCGTAAAEQISYSFVAKLDQSMGTLAAGDVLAGSFTYELGQPTPPGGGTSTYSVDSFVISWGTPGGRPGVSTLSAPLANISVNDNGAFTPPADTIGVAGFAAGGPLGTIAGVQAAFMTVSLRDETLVALDAQAPPRAGLIADDFPTLAAFRVTEAGTNTEFSATIVRLETQPEYRLIADTATAVPGSGGVFTGFFNGPTVDGGNVAFQGIGTGSSQGIYLSIDGDLLRIADRNSIMPGTGSTFFLFGNPFVFGDDVAFFGGGGTGNTGFGIYKGDAGGVGAVAGSSLTQYNAPRFEQGVVAFLDRCSGLRSVCLEDAGSVIVVADESTMIPGTATLFKDYFSLSFDGATAAFGGQNAAGFGGLFTGSGGAIQTVAMYGDPMPGQPVPFAFYGETDIDGGVVAFIGNGEVIGNRRPQGVYIRDASAVAKLVDTDTAIPTPVIDANFQQFQSVAIENGTTAFLGRGFAQQGSSFQSLTGLFAITQGSSRTLIDNYSMIGGKRVTDVGFISEGFDGETLVFTARGPSFNAIYALETGSGDSTRPTSNAGPNQSIHAGQSVNLTGLASFDDTTVAENLGYQWTFTSQPSGSTATLNDPTSAVPSFIADLPGTFELDLIVEDEAGNTSGADSVQVSSANTAPEARAGADQVVIVGTTVVLDGGGSTDADLDPIAFDWTLVSLPPGSTAQIANAGAVSPSFTPDQVGIYLVSLTVTDGFVASSPDVATITVISGQEYAENQLGDASEAINAIPPQQLDAPGHASTLSSWIGQILGLIQQNNVSQAVNKLDNTLVRTDGCALRGSPDAMGGGGQFAGDWINDCSQQIALYELLMNARAALQ